jgi:hypothetical protein
LYCVQLLSFIATFKSSPLTSPCRDGGIERAIEGECQTIAWQPLLVSQGDHRF